MATTSQSSSSPTSPTAVTVNYGIASSTPHSGKYGPENILVDKPTDQSSRWSGAFQGNTNQWIILRLESLVVLKTITFGKHSKPHPCNMKEFKVFVGITEDHMTEVLHAGLKNDPVPETFPLKYVNQSGVSFPTQYVKIVPLLAHGQNFHVSIWHVALNGIVDSTYVEQVLSAYDEYRETAVLRSVLKHLRQRRLLTPYQSILSRANIHLEHPLTTQLHESIVLQGNWSKSEQLLESMCSSGLFESYLRSSPARSEWTRLLATDADGDVPPARGGHAMCMDPVNEIIYIFGGWNGEKSLDDFWAYNVKEDKWKVLSHSTTQEQNAPGARSCHKMVFDTKTGSIYVLGRLNDADGLRAPARHQGAVADVAVGHQAVQQPAQSVGAGPSSDTDGETPKMLSSEFYRYHTRGMLAGKWDFLSIDTAASGGPPLVFDHQMVMDSDAQMLYVFGGRVVDGDWDVSKYPGLYSYNISSSRWKLLHPHAENALGSQTIPPRFGHSMVLDPLTKTLYIFAGQRDDKYLSDMYTYHIPTGTSTEIYSNFSAAGGPDPCFTQRAVIDPSLKEIYVFCGLTRNPTTTARNTLRANLSNWVYRYDTVPGIWMQIMPQPDRLPSEQPMPRFAHQVAYNPINKSIFLHGGNAGGILTNDSGKAREADGDHLAGDTGNDDSKDSTFKEKRLDDFWRMELKRPGPEEIIRQAKFQIRRQQFREMCEEAPPVRALNFLQTQVSSVVDHNNAKETEIFRSLLTHLLSPPPLPPTVKSDSRSSTSASSAVSSLEHEDTRDLSSRPAKRSRAGKESSETGVWTNQFSADDSPSSSIQVAQHLREMTDPLEAMIRGRDGVTPLSGSRYSQRTQVFENILKFINDGDKQPQESLLDLVEKDRCRTFS